MRRPRGERGSFHLFTIARARTVAHRMRQDVFSWRRVNHNSIEGNIMKNIVIASLCSSVLTAVAMGAAYEIHHPNLKDAYGAAENAIKFVQAAFDANKKVGFGGHGEAAIKALQQAQSEIIEGDKYNEANQKK
jgi:hypothetical protein